jgi:alpha-beta hydrolase superfamily lysophospholipase
LIAILAASRKIIQPEAMVLLTPAAPRGIPSMTISVMRSFSQIFANTLWRREQANISFAKACYAFFELMPIVQRRQIFRDFVPESSRVIEQAGLWFFDQERSSEVIGQNISCDILVVAATQDRVTPAKVVKKIFQKLDKEVPVGFRVDYKEFSDHAHWVLAEPGWEEVIGFVFSWLEEVFPSS